MNWKELLRKFGKGALSGALAVLGGIQLSGLPMDENSVKIFAGSVISGALTGGINAFEQNKIKKGRQ